MTKQSAADHSSAGFVPVCAIGASAGGVGALQALFRLLPGDLGLAYVVVIHLAPDYPSAMHEILATCTKMPVFQVNDGPKLQANCVYVIAPDSELVIDGDNVQSRPFTDLRGRRAPIDMFFRSVAAGRADGIAVVLTGGGADGSLGVRAIKEAGGIVMVQDPTEAGFPSMPEHAIATGMADVVAPLASLAQRIINAARNTPPVDSPDADYAGDDLRRIIAFLRSRTGHDFSGYKRSTVQRRVYRRMQIRQIANPADYAKFLQAEPEEARHLLSNLLISVTMFFRDPAMFATLNRCVIRPLLESRGSTDTNNELRAWVVGCATGEEAYSLAILMLEQIEQLNAHVPIQIFATDLDEQALATAREGRYPRSIEADVSAERLKRFFVDEGTHYRIDRRVRDLVLFAAHSIVREPPFMRLDLITCRNVLIYFERALQQQVGSIFRYGLKPEGYLFLGSAETVDTSSGQFTAVDREARIYRAMPAKPAYIPVLPAPAAWNGGLPAAAESRRTVALLDAGEVLADSHAAALEKNAPPSALVDADHAVLHLSPTVGRFILLSAGPFSGQLPSIVRPELRLDLKLALDRIFDAQQPSITRPIDVSIEGDMRRISLYVAPWSAGDGAAPRATVFFLDCGPTRNLDVCEFTPPDELRHLHGELKAAQESEHAGHIRHESALQELRASNEELQSLNEEYRSTAEELETSKEELQSINEEMQTVNAELKSKLGIISAAHNDLQNLTASSEIGTLFLDLDLRIRMFTPRIADLINVTDADVGRPVTNFTHQLQYSGIETDVRRVLRDLAPFETEVRTVDGRWFVVRIRPYKTLDGKVEGAVVTFDDNTDQRIAREALRESERRYRSLFESIDEGVAIIEIVRGADHTPANYRFIDVNSAFARHTGLIDVENRFGSEVAPETTALWLDTYGRVARTGEPIRFEHFDKPSGRWFDVYAARLDASDDARVSIVFDDITDRKHADHVLRESESWLVAQKDAFRAAMDDAPLAQSLGILAAWMNANANDGRRCAFFILEKSGIGVRHVVGMPEAYARAVNASAHSPEFSACSRALSGKPVIIPDVHADPAWKQWESLADEHGIRGCWWFPVETAAGKLIGSFAQYMPKPHEPNARDRDRELATAVTQTAAIILSRHQQNEDRAKAEAALAESETRYHALFKASPAPFLVLTPDAPRFTITEVNDAYLSATMRTRDEVVGRGVFDAYSNNSDDATIAAVNTLRASLENVLVSRRADTLPGLKYDLSRPDGAFEERWWSPVNSPVLDENNEVKAIIHNANDVTVERRALAALSKSEARFRTLAETAPALIWQNDAAGENIFANRYFLDYAGLPDGTISGEKWRTLVHPDDIDVYLTDFMTAVREQLPFHHRNRFCRFDGVWRWFETYAQPLDDEKGGYLGHVGVSSDVTMATEAELSLRESEQRQQLLIEGVPQLVWRAVSAGNWTWASLQWTEYTGQAATDSHGAGWLEPVHPDDRERVKAIWAGAIERGEYNAEYRIRRYSDKRYRWFQTRATPVRDDAERIVEWLGTSTDIDDLRQLQERQKLLVAELQHRTRNLITVVRAVSQQTLRESASLDEFRDRFGDRLSALSRVQGLLSHLSAGQRVTFEDVLRSELAALGAVEDKGVLEGIADVPLRSATVQTFSLALHELATNALKYGALGSPNGHLTVRWELTVSEEGAPRLLVDWRETGVDMTHVGERPLSGFGRALIEHALPYQLEAKTTYALMPDGVHCTIDVPASNAQD